MKPENCSALNKLCLCDVCILNFIKNDDNIQPKLLCSDCCNTWNRSRFDDDETILNRICKKHHLDYDEALTYLYWREFNNYCKKIDHVDEKIYNKDEYEAESKKNLDLICDVTRAVSQFETHQLDYSSDNQEELKAHLDHLAKLKQRVENCTIKTFLKIIGVECNYKITQKVTHDEILQNRDSLLQSIESYIRLTEIYQGKTIYDESMINATKEACNSTAIKAKMELSELLLKLFLGFLGACGLLTVIVFIITCIQCC